MPEMGIAGRAAHLRPAHEKRTVIMRIHSRFLIWPPEAGPARSGLELCRGGEQRRPATDAQIHARTFLVPIWAGKRPFGAMLPCDVILLGRQLLPPFVIAFDYLGLGIISRGI